jgi:hypothetical protein
MGGNHSKFFWSPQIFVLSLGRLPMSLWTLPRLIPHASDMGSRPRECKRPFLHLHFFVERVFFCSLTYDYLVKVQPDGQSVPHHSYNHNETKIWYLLEFKRTSDVRPDYLEEKEEMTRKQCERFMDSLRKTKNSEWTFFPRTCGSLWLPLINLLLLTTSYQ